MSGYDDANEVRHDHRAPYTEHHQIPTVQKYREEKDARRIKSNGKPGDVYGGFWRKPESFTNNDALSARSNQDATAHGGSHERDVHEGESTGKDSSDDDHDDGEDETRVDTSEANPIARNPKQRRKGLMRKGPDERAEREVTDPVTHLPVKIFDFTADSLQDVEENFPPFGATSRTATGLSNKTKAEDDLNDEVQEMTRGRQSINALFPPPAFDSIRTELTSIVKSGVTLGLAGSAVIVLLAMILESFIRPLQSSYFSVSSERAQWITALGPFIIAGALGAGSVWLLIVGIRGWIVNCIDNLWDDQVWRASRQSNRREAKAHETETVTWLNMLMSSVWPLINPDLFTSLADTLEDVMQASLPSLVQMVSVEDIGQGRENLRILGIRWLPTGAASRSVGANGQLESAEKSKQHNDCELPGEGEIDDNANAKGKDGEAEQHSKKGETQAEDGTEKQISEGMEAEEGDFVNLEIAFAYRARASKSPEDRAKDMHLYLAFYLPGNLKIPVWVNVRGIIGTVRLRLQLAPDPPFFALCTLTFLGQPKVDIGCIPLVKRGLNIMNLPLISNFVQSSMDAALAQYVAPKSLTLDLKDMLAGDDFKKDTSARGVLVVDIKRGYDFKMGDVPIPMISDGKSDPYVSVGWAKFGKPMWSTRVLISEMQPVWQETAYILVTQEELNVDERLRVQLWDSDRFTADDDLGRIEVNLKKIMKDDASNGQMCSRTDGFRALKAGDNMPGKLEWSVGYFSKCRIQKCQLEKQTFNPGIRSAEQLEQHVDEICRRKLREAGVKEGRHTREAEELEQQIAQERKRTQDAMMISAPPPDEFPSGIFSIQLHQITGLEFENFSKAEVDKNGKESDEVEEGEGLPSAYCEVIINQDKVFKTRTKPKNARPFYNAATERFIPDWRKAEVFVSVRDARVSENDPLLGIVHLQLGDVFKERSQIDGMYPLTGGVGYGRIRISMVWRSVQLQARPEALGWMFGTLQIQPSVSMSDAPADLKELKLRFHTDISHRKMHAYPKEQMWKPRKGRPLKIPVHKRYSSCLAVQFRSHGLLHEKTTAFAILWLRDIPDDEEREMALPVWHGDFERAKACYLEEYGDRLGTIKLKLTFCSGLSATHRKWARKDPNLRNVFEVLDTARDNDETMKTESAAGIVDHDLDDISSDDSSDNEDNEDAIKADAAIIHHDEQYNESNDSTQQTTNSQDTHHENPKGLGEMNLIERVKEYKDRAPQEHRRNRGIMQYKAPRTAQWAMGKAGRVESKFRSIFSRHTRQPGVETEV